MYNDLPDLFPPSDEAVLWRYMDFTKFMSLLEKSALFFCRPDLLGDPFEGSISPATPPIDPLQVGRVIAEQDLDWRLIARFVGVNCWHLGEFESEAMWKLYAEERNGIAIKTEFAHFKDAFICEKERGILASVVQYRDYKNASIPYHNIFLPFFHKRLSFQHEKEVRALCSRNPESDEPGAPNGYYCKVDLTKLVGEIVVAPFAEGWFIDLVRSLAERYGLGDKVRPSTLSEAPTFISRVVHRVSSSSPPT